MRLENRVVEEYELLTSDMRLKKIGVLEKDWEEIIPTVEDKDAAIEDIASYRNFRCPFYVNECLRFAARRNFKAFSCKRCDDFRRMIWN